MIKELAIVATILSKSLGELAIIFAFYLQRPPPVHKTKNVDLTFHSWTGHMAQRQTPEKIIFNGG